MRQLAAATLAFHLLWILWVIFGAFWTRGRPWLTAVHIASILWGIVAELGPWPCPLTVAENWFEARAGVQPWTGGFLVHYLDAVVYPTVSVGVIDSCAVLVCGLNLAIYGHRLFRARSPRTRL